MRWDIYFELADISTLRRSLEEQFINDVLELVIGFVNHVIKPAFY